MSKKLLDKVEYLILLIAEFAVRTSTTTSCTRSLLRRMSKPCNPIADGKEVHYDTLSRLNNRHRKDRPRQV